MMQKQMRLNAFFQKQKTDGDSANSTLVDTNQNIASNTLSSISDTPIQDANPAPVSPQKALKQNAKTDYERYFLPFQLPSHAILAPYNRYMENPEKMAAATSRLEHLISREDATTEPITLADLKAKFGGPRCRGLKTASIVDIVERINSSSDHPVDLTKEGGDNTQDPLKLLKQIPMKYLHFPEDVRPPYYGTYTKPHTSHEGAKLSRNPFSRALHEADYDYDSEAEWEEPEEGEDLDSDGEDDAEEEGEDDMEGFLDDEEDAQVKRRLISSDLEPVSTGLCWEDAHGVSISNDGSGAISTEFKEFRMGFLLGRCIAVKVLALLTSLEPQPHSIDPFSTAYWAPPPTAPVAAPAAISKDSTITSMMQPPRLPLTQRPMNSMMNSLNSTPIAAASGAGGKPPKPPKRLIPPDQLPEFKAQVEGSDLTKIALIEALKKKYESP
jgi:chromatin assembly factor 1 subunit A